MPRLSAFLGLALGLACTGALALAQDKPEGLLAPTPSAGAAAGPLPGGASCYDDPAAAACATFERSDADWTDDLTQLCDAAPYMVGCWLWEQCKSGAASGKYCSLSSLTANTCSDMPLVNATTPGCEAWSALCAEGSVVAQCTSPGPAPDIVNTLTVRDGINSICSTHLMDGCELCGPHDGPGQHDFASCTFPGPMAIFAWDCYAMREMPECDMTGFLAFCSDADVAATFPTVCTDPPNPATVQPPSPPASGEAPSPGSAPEAAPSAPAPAPAPAASAAWAVQPGAALLTLAATLVLAAAAL
ncbi:hypothetical protein ABPG75_001669 [Micractinium tetrahymenae]